MATNETLAAAPATNAADPNVRVPDVVARAAAAADAAHKAAYGDQAVTAPVTDAPVIPAALAPPEIKDTGDKQISIVAADDPKVPDREQVPDTPPVDTPKVPARETSPKPAPQLGTPEQEHHKFLAMQGRYQQSQGVISAMQTQMQELGDELQRVHLMLQQRGPVPSSGPGNTPRIGVGVLTDEDKAAYGEELTTFVMKAAKDAVAPELSQLEQENLKLRQQVTRQAQNTLYGQLRAAVPDWESINTNPRFVAWLRLPDVYSQQVRSTMLKQAFQAANAPRVIAFFKGFLQEEVATGHVQAPRSEQSIEAPREPAVPLSTFAAPGPARPATGDTQVPDAKPVYTRTYIKGFYDQVRAGLWAGREADKARLESDIFAAQREGRVR